MCLFFFLPILAKAATDAECLKHMGGAFAGVQCYVGLSNDLVAENQNLIKKIMKTIPKGNKNRNLLHQYEREQKDIKRFCQISRDSSTEWVSEKRPINPMYYQPDVIYYECVFESLEHQNKFLKKILNNASQE
jgi:hypothetical protein